MDADLAGAKASNAGDDFHVLWAMQHAMRVLAPDSGLTAVAVEGVPNLQEAESSGTTTAAWEGVDVALFYGGNSLATSQRIELQQLKYSTASPDKAWTVARLCQSTNRQRNNSVIARLAKAFAEARRIAPALSDESLQVKLVSNQPISEEVICALDQCTSSSLQGSGQKPRDDRTRLRSASGLSEKDFGALAKALDFTDCAGPSRFQIHERVIAAIGEVAAGESRPMMLELRQVVYSRMLPGQHGPITREVILGAMFVSDQSALLPCPSVLKRPLEIVPRQVVRDLVSTQLPRHQRICLHGEGGCGKTTALLELQMRLPEGSELVIFDCYGSGRYLDSDGQRHLPRHAVLHLCNEIASRVGAPMLLIGAGTPDYPRELITRLRKAAAIVAARNPSALLVIAIDAADNSVIAAQRRNPPERSFVHDIAELGDLPSNARLVISARTGRLAELRLPEEFLPVQIGDFGLPETKEFVRLQDPDRPSTWIEDLHHLSGGNARVISYAFDYARETLQDPLKYLRPSGKDLQRIFQERIKEALQKGGDRVEFGRLCAALVALPRPIPIVHLANILGINESHLRDMGNDLAPGLQETSEHFGFTDEDFESFVHGHSATSIQTVTKQASSYMEANHQHDSYCADHVATLMLAAGESQKLLKFTQEHPEPKAIKDPVRRREVQLHRLKLAMRVARDCAQPVEAAMVMLRGAKALKTDAAVRKMLTENIDLSASYSQASLRRAVLTDPKLVRLHGRVLCSLMLVCSRSGDAVSARDWKRQFDAWLATRSERRGTEQRTEKWTLTWKDLATEGEAMLRSMGTAAGIEGMNRWTPRTHMPPAITTVCRNLLASGEKLLVEKALQNLGHQPFWDIFIRVPLAIAGGPVDPTAISNQLGRWLRRSWLNPDVVLSEISGAGQIHGSQGNYRMLISAAEIVASHAGLSEAAKSVLNVFATPSWRDVDRISPSHHRLLDIAMRAHALLEAVAGREATGDTFLEDAISGASNSNDPASRKSERWKLDRLKRLREFVALILPIYNARARLLISAPKDRMDTLRSFAEKLRKFGHSHSLRSDDHDVRSMRTFLAESTAELLHLPEIDAREVAELTLSITRSSFSNQTLNAVQTLTMNRNTHEVIHEHAVLRAKSIRTEREPATDRADQLIELARLLSPISRSDAEALFAEASEVLGEVDYDSVFHLEMLEDFAKKGATSFERPRRRVLAGLLGTVTSDMWGYLGNSDRFPWESVGRSMTVLDPSVALATFSRWDDEGCISIEQLAPEFLGVALPSSDNLESARVAIPILYLTGEMDSNTLDPISARLDQESPSQRPVIAEEVIRLASLNLDGHNGISELRAAEGLTAHNQSTAWASNARTVLAFFDEATAATTKKSEHEPLVQSPKGTADQYIGTFVASSSLSFTTVSEIEQAYMELAAHLSKDASYFDTSLFYSSMRRKVRRADRRAHLEALMGSTLRSRFDQADAITQAALAWVADSPAVAAWCEDRLPDVIVDRLQFLYQPRMGDDNAFERLLNASGLKDDEIATTLLRAIGSNPEKWDSGMLYSLLGLLARYLSSDQAAEVLSRHLQNEFASVDGDLVPVNVTDVPEGVEESLGRAIYAFMGDIELSKRWCAAHALRAAARLDLQVVVDAAFAAWHRLQEPAFRNPQAPSYWLASRLWLLIAAARISREAPQTLKAHGQMLYSVATDQNFPHLLCRHFAKEAVEALVEQGFLSLDTSAKEQLAKVNRPGVPLVSINRAPRKRFDRVHSTSARRFEFDSMDTLPYWYEPAIRLFADVETEDFLDIAEAWIVDVWQADPQVRMWDREPRKSKFSRERLSSSNRHGSLPSVERYSTHLEWHAMYCAVGQLIVVRPFVKQKDGDYGGFSYWMSRSTLTAAPFWLADLRAIKPLQQELWRATQQDDQSWLDGVSTETLLAELCLQNSLREVVIDGRITGAEGDRRWTINVSSALVSTNTAAALLRSLQGVRTSWDYAIPDEDADMEIHAGVFKLTGWVSHVERDTALDDDDPYRREVRRLNASPGRRVIKTLALRSPKEDLQQWVGASEGVYFRHLAWSDEMDDSSLRYGSAFPRSEGYRLIAGSEAIHRYLEARKMDLIVEITMTRRTKESSHDDSDSEGPTETEHDLIVVFRRNGHIEGAQGRLGTWSVPSSRAKD